MQNPQNPKGLKEIRVSCHDLKKTGIMVYQTGRGTILAGTLILTMLAGYAHYLDTANTKNPAAEQNLKKAVQADTPSKEIRKTRAAKLLKPRNYARQVRSAGSKHNIDPRLIHAVIEVESGGNPNAISPRGAKGLMQITPSICRRYGVSNPFDVEQNINAGCAYLAHLLENLNGDLERALAAYNCGLGRVLMYNGPEDPSETRLFVDKIISKYRSKILKDLIVESH
jgi:soluble lytic murein transglycosylase-like protein